MECMAAGGHQSFHRAHRRVWDLATWLLRHVLDSLPGFPFGKQSRPFIFLAGCLQWFWVRYVHFIMEGTLNMDCSFDGVKLICSDLSRLICWKHLLFTTMHEVVHDSKHFPVIAVTDGNLVREIAMLECSHQNVDSVALGSTTPCAHAIMYFLSNFLCSILACLMLLLRCQSWRCVSPLDPLFIVISGPVLSKSTKTSSIKVYSNQAMSDRNKPNTWDRMSVT